MTRTDESQVFWNALASIRRLRDLARSTGFQPSDDAEIARLVREVEIAAEAIRSHAIKSQQARIRAEQPELFG